MAEIQRSAVEPDKRNVIPRVFNPKKDKDTIAAWRSELERIVRVFEVRSTIHSLLTLLTVHLQTELAIHTHVAVTGIREDVGDIRELVSDMHRTMSKDQEEADSREQMVGNHGVLFTMKRILTTSQTRARCAVSTVVVDPGPYP